MELKLIPEIISVMQSKATIRMVGVVILFDCIVFIDSFTNFKSFSNIELEAGNYLKELNIGKYICFYNFITYFLILM